MATILTAAVLTNLVVTNTIVHGLGLQSHSLRKYYAELKAVAVALDVTSLVWGVLLARKINRSGHVVLDVVLAIAVQVVHDVLFGLHLRSVASDQLSPTMRLFRAYADEHGRNILVVDAVMMVTCVVLARLMNDWTASSIHLAGALGLYVHLLLLDRL
jgi:hypothetical protein